MIPAPLPENERRRLGELYALGLLDSDADPAFDEVTRIAQRILDVPIALVSLVDAERQWFKSSQGLAASETHRDLAFCAHAILDDDVFVVENATDDPRFHDSPLVSQDPSIRFYAGAPLKGPQGNCLGTLCVIDDEPRRVSVEELATLRDLATIIQREIAQASEAVTDPLTGLHNRRGLVTAGERLLSIADRTSTPMVVGYADLDGLKEVNDVDGHAAGDEAINAAATVLRDALREADIVARVGGDEFAMILSGATAETVRIPLARLEAAIDRLNSTAAQSRPIALSVGWVERFAGETLDDVIRRADAAMYETKHG